MINLESSLIELKARRALLEIQLLGLQRRSDRSVEAAEEMERLERQICELDDRIDRTAQGDPEGAVEHLTVESLEAGVALDRLRSEILEALRDLAAPLRAYEGLAERQRELAGQIRQATGKNNGYAAYIGTALLRTSDYDDELQFVVELLRRARVVS